MLKRSISFALAFLLSSGAFAATGAGHAQAELTNPLTVTSPIDVNWGTIAIDPSAGPQTISMSTGGIVSCPSSYVCPATATRGLISITGAPNTPIDLSLSGQIAILSDGNGNTLTFDPFMNNASDVWVGRILNESGYAAVSISGTIDFTGNEVAGVYSSSNAGGSGYVMTVNY